MSTSNPNSLVQRLQEIAENNPQTIKAFVINEALSSGYNDTKGFFAHLAEHGCISGMIPSLTYYADTEAFFDTYYEEIIELKSEFEEATGTPLNIPHQIKNYLAWFAFEQVAYQLTCELGLDI
ncbi:DUF7222 domain-containing protein [Tenacibaculum agarivorans]|uniref:DUF7222 domain-containing protein n=1 Tax=Tenacibaculum agarivorans TaxID=1908389 RepID=UPI00094BBDDF|nr:hypothetical protein [Tenacibaculum agarivorans]